MTLTLRHYPPASDNVRLGIEVVLAGSYEPGADVVFEKPPRILDLGAHVGSFSVWAMSRWPGAQITAYEPHPTSAHYARVNTEGMGVEVVPYAVVNDCVPATTDGIEHDAHVLLYEGKDNTGQRSIYQLGEQLTDSVIAKAIHASTLPPCDILKIDTEGCELDILRAFDHLATVRVLMVEWHRQEDYKELLSWLPTLGFELRRDDTRGAWQADRNLIFVRQARSVSEEPMWLVPRRDLNAILDLIPEYDLGALPLMPAPRVLDVGAHVGGFAWYVLRHYPNARIQCFEAHPDTFSLLTENVRGLSVEVYQCAVVHPKRSGTVRLYEGKNGRHECSTRTDVRWPHCSQNLSQWIDVPTFDAANLPPADILKIDVEGAEEDVLRGYGHLAGIKALLVEPHPINGQDINAQRRTISALAMRAGLKPIEGHVLRFVR